MRYIIIAILVILTILPHYVSADSTNQLDTVLVPNKIIANTDGIIQVFPKNFGTTINNLVATSSDSTIVQILGIENDAIHGTFNIKIRALDAGQVTISMAASGFSSLELPVTVYSDSETPTSLLIKATPQTFSTTGPNSGYVSVETVNSDGIPTPVSVDTPIKLSVSDSTIAGLATDQMIMKQGSYYTMEKFTVTKPGVVQIYASAPSMQPVSSSITVNNEDTSYTLQAYAYPPVVNVDQNAVSYVIVQLHDSSGNPVLAQNDIHVSVRVVDPNDTTSINTSGQSPLVQLNSDLLIKKGSYWGDIPVEFTAGQSENFTINISAKGYVISTVPASTTITASVTGTTGTTAPGASTTASGTSTTTTTASASGSSTTTSTTATNTATSGSGAGTSVPTNSSATSTPSSSSATATGTTTETSTELSICAKNPIPISTSQIQIYAIAQNFIMDDKTPCFYSLPVLATGNQELVGVLALKDSTGYPALAKSGLSFQMDSSDVSTVSIPSVEMGYGEQSALVFAQVGNTANPITLNVVSGSPQQIMPVIASPSKTSSGLMADPILTTVLPNTLFPLAIYTTNNGALSSFKNDFTALISPQESISPVQLTVASGEPIFLSNETLLKTGAQNIAITTPDYSSSFAVTGAYSKSNGMILGFPDQIFSNSVLLFSIELLDDNQLPILADKDINLKLVSSDPSVLYVPDSVQIKKGSYYATFDASSKGSGAAEIAVLADGLPLSKFDMTITSFIPTVNVSSDDHVDNNSPLTATATATYNNLPVSGLNVDWTVTGATIKNKDSVTDSNGEATISLIANDPNTVSIQASVGGGPYQAVAATKQVSVNQPLLAAASPSVQPSQGSTQSNGITIMGVNPIIFVIPGAAAAVFAILKKKNVLEGLSERISITQKFSEMMGRTSNSQER